MVYLIVVAPAKFVKILQEGEPYKRDFTKLPLQFFSSLTCQKVSVKFTLEAVLVK